MADALPSAPTRPNNETPYLSEFAAIQLQLTHASPPEAVVLLGRADKLRDKLTNPEAVEQLFRNVTAGPQASPLLRDDAHFYLSRIALQHGDLANAQAELQALGFIQHWAVTGPFAADESDSGVANMLGPEEGYRPSATFAFASRQLHWTSIPDSCGSPWVNLGHVFAGHNSGTIFAATSVFSEIAQDVALRFSADLPHAIYINGERVALETAISQVAFDQHTAIAHLEPGWNSVVFKLARSSQSSPHFGLRLTGLHGEPLKLASALRSRDVLLASAPATKEADDLLDQASTTAAMDASASHLETLALLEHIRNRDSGHDHMEAAARRSPTPERWLHVAELCSEATCRFQALSIALRLNAAYEPAILALADYYTSRKQLTKARDLLQDALRREPNDFVANDKLIALHLQAGLNALAAQESDALSSFASVPLWLNRRLMSRYDELGVPVRASALATAVLKQEFTAADARALVLRGAGRHDDTRQLTALYQDAARADAFDPSPAQHLADLLARGGDLVGAEQAYSQAVARAPFDAALRQSLATIMARNGKREQAAAELALAAKLNSESTKPQTNTLVDDSEFMADAAVLAAAYQPTNDSAVSLADVRVEHLQANGSTAVHVQQVVAVNTTQAAADYAQQAVRYSPESQSLQVVHARVIKRNGRQITADDEGENAVAEAGAAMYYDVRARVFRFAVEAGDVVELEYRLTPTSATNVYGDYFGDIVVFGSNIPQRLKRLVVIAPTSRPLHVVEERMSPAQRTTRGNERVYAWEAHDVPALHDEPRGPALTEVAPYVHVSTFTSWQEVGAWYARLVRPQFEMDAALKQAADKVLAGKKSELDKITAIHEFVLRQTHYVALEFGIYSYKPYPVTQTYARRFGDCKDKASLIVALLRYAGVDAEMALVRTRRLGRMSDDATSIALFNHAIVHVPKYDLWLDGTAEYAGLHELPLEDQGAMALTVALDGKATLRTIPVTRAEDNYTRRLVRVQVHSDGRMDFNGTTYTHGEDAPGLRREYEVAERQRDSVRERLAEVFPTVRVEDVQVTSPADLQRDVEVNFRGSLDTFTGRNALPLQSSWMPRSFAQSLAVLTERKEDLILPAPWISEEELHFQLPGSANVDSLPADTSISTEFGTASLHYERRGRELIVHTSVQFTKLRITPDEYSSFRAFCQQVERAFRTEVKIHLAA
jgi:transglutaminase-like putative cysteine protease